MLCSSSSLGRRVCLLLAPLVLLASAGCELVSGLSDLEVQATAKPDKPDAGGSSARPDASPSLSASSGDAAIMSASVSVTATSTPDAAPSVSVATDSGTLDAGSDCTALLNGECDPIAGCGCDGARECFYTPTSSKATAMCLRPGTARAGEPCEQPNDCVAGALCHAGLCAKVCDDDDDCSGLARCLPEVGGSDAGSGVGYCSDLCNPLHPHDPASAQRECNDAATCVVLAGTSRTECVVQSNTFSVGAECEVSSDCQAGLACVDSICQKWCSAAGDDCGSGESCEVAFTLGNVNFGYCMQAECAIEGDNPCAIMPDNCGCDSGDQCQLVSQSGATDCLAVGQRGLLEPCEGDTDCAFGLACIGNRCRPYCEDSCAEGACLDILWSGVPGGGYCPDRACDPVDISRDDTQVTPCESNTNCTPDFSGDSASAVCANSTGYEYEVGSQCGFSSDCVEGAGCICDGKFDCFDSSFYGACLPYCADDADCSSGSCFKPGSGYGVCCTPPDIGGECDLASGCGCTGDTKCSAIDLLGTTACLTRVQGTCFQDTDCPVGTICTGDTVLSTGVCRPSCVGACSQGEGECLSLPLADGGTSYACMGGCDPLNPSLADDDVNGCGARTTCRRSVIGDLFDGDLSSCQVPGSYSGIDGDYCLSDDDCASGLGCNLATEQCAALCRGDGDCPMGYLCDTVDSIGIGSNAMDIVGVCYVP